MPHGAPPPQDDPASTGAVEDGISSNYQRFEGGHGGGGGGGDVGATALEGGTTSLEIAPDGYPAKATTPVAPPQHRTGNGSWGRRIADGTFTFAGLLVNDERFKRFIISLILLNAILMGIETFDFVTENPQVLGIFERLDRGFLLLFTIELFFQFLHHGMYLFNDGWLVFDFTVVFASWAFATLQIVRAFRIFRALRLVTKIKELKNLVKVLLGVIPQMFAIGILLLLIFYIFAVMFTQLFKHLYEDGYTSGNYFSRLDITCFTLFQLMTLDSWSLITHEVMSVYPWAWFPFITFVLISSFVVINLVIGVICDAVASAAQKEYDARLEEFHAMASGDSDDRARLEHKIDDLTSSLRMLMESQRRLYQEVQQLKSKKE